MNSCLRELTKHLRMVGFVACIFASGYRQLSAQQSQQSGSAPAEVGVNSPSTQAETLMNSQQQRIRSSYVLGVDDQISLRVIDVEELNEKQFRVDMTGCISLPMVGRIRVAGLTVEQLEEELSRRLKVYLVHPDVSAAVMEFRSQPVSVIGAVKNPGVLQVQGRKTLVEMLSLAGGLDPTAGPTVKIARRKEWGGIPGAFATEDPTGESFIAEINLKSIVEAKGSEANITIKPHDVISVPRAEMVYVIGQVQKAGGFALNDREGISVLKALSLAGGMDRSAAPARAKILRAEADGHARSEIALNLNAILAGKATDIEMRPEDILFIPGSAPKKAAARAAEAAIQIGTGIAIWGRR